MLGTTVRTTLPQSLWQVRGGDWPHPMVVDANWREWRMNDTKRTPEDELLVASLLEWKAKEGLSNREVDQRSEAAAFRINHTRIGEYEKDKWKELSVRERRHLRGFLDFVSSAMPAKESHTYAEGVDYVAGRLADLVDELARITEASAAPAPKPKVDRMPQGSEALRERFLAAISEFTDLQVEDICGINHETVRQYRGGDWPERGPNRASVVKILAMIKRYEAILEESSIVAREKLPPQAAGLIKLAEFLQKEPSFAEKHPRLGWISFADEMAKAARKLGDMTIYDELVWLGYKVATHFDPKTASRVTLEDVELDMSQFFNPISPK